MEQKVISTTESLLSLHFFESFHRPSDLNQVPDLEGLMLKAFQKTSSLPLPTLLRFLGSPGWLQTQYEAEDDLELLILLPPLPMCWDYRWVPLCLVYGLLGICWASTPPTEYIPAPFLLFPPTHTYPSLIYLANCSLKVFLSHARLQPICCKQHFCSLQEALGLSPSALL